MIIAQNEPRPTFGEIDDSLQPVAESTTPSCVSLVIPAYNEAEAIAGVVRRAQEALALCVEDFEVIVVDDGSADRTAEFARRAGARVISHPYNRGYGNSLKTGILAARHEYVVICDADESYPLNQLPRLLENSVAFDMVVGARQGVHFHGSWKKSIGRRLQLALVNFVTGTKVPDANSGFRLLRRSLAVRYFDFLCTGFSFTTSITIAMICEQYLVRFVKVSYHKRCGSSHVRYLRDSVRSLQIITHCILRYNPLKAFALCAMLPVPVAVLMFLAAFVQPVMAIGGVIALCTSMLIGACGMMAYCANSRRDVRAVDAGVYSWLDDATTAPSKWSLQREAA
jgi:glycosyl transferase family 2